MQVESYYLKNYEHCILYDYADKEDFILMMINEVVSKKLNLFTLIKKYPQSIIILTKQISAIKQNSPYVSKKLMKQKWYVKTWNDFQYDGS